VRASELEAKIGKRGDMKDLSSRKVPEVKEPRLAFGSNRAACHSYQSGYWQDR